MEINIGTASTFEIYINNKIESIRKERNTTEAINKISLDYINSNVRTKLLKEKIQKYNDTVSKIDLIRDKYPNNILFKIESSGSTYNEDTINTDSLDLDNLMIFNLFGVRDNVDMFLETMEEVHPGIKKRYMDEVRSVNEKTVRMVNKYKKLISLSSTMPFKKFIKRLEENDVNLSGYYEFLRKRSKEELQVPAPIEEDNLVKL